MRANDTENVRSDAVTSENTVKLSIVILCWNSKGIVGECLSAIFGDAPGFDFEVIVVDNGSTDGTGDFVRSNFDRATLMPLAYNSGFAAGNNAGIRASKGEYVLILNPDAVLRRGALSGWLAFADGQPACGAFACRVLNPDGSYQHSARPFPSFPRLWAQALLLKYAGIDPDRYLFWNGETERNVDWTAGCCLLARKRVLAELQGFDERFFYHYEDVDLCKRIWSSGYPIRYTPSVQVVHIGNAKGSLPAHLELEKCRNRYRYFRKHCGATADWHCRWSQTLRFSLRAIIYKVLAVWKRRDPRFGRLARLNVELAGQNLKGAIVDRDRTASLADAGELSDPSTPLLAQNESRQEDRSRRQGAQNGE